MLPCSEQTGSILNLLICRDIAKDAEWISRYPFWLAPNLNTCKRVDYQTFLKLALMIALQQEASQSPERLLEQCLECIIPVCEDTGTQRLMVELYVPFYS